MHKSVLLETVLSFFKDQRVRIFADGTLGAGGHAHAILATHPEIEKYYGFDLDPEALEIARKNLEEFSDKLSLIPSNFSLMEEWIEEKVDGILLDLGVSSMQLDRKEKGFSFSPDSPLDMRMDPDQDLTAEIVLNTFSERKIAEILRDYGEEPKWQKAAKAIAEARRKKRLKTSRDLAEALKDVSIGKRRKGKWIHPLTLIFQALRIYVNDELKNLESGLQKAMRLLAPKGRLAVISFHSLEDRIVKETFRNAKEEFTILTKKPLIASDEEIRQNPRSRSAKMRVIEKKAFL